ncbi:Nif3-like dinuclear metal center hexameric protein [Blattabacterium cuenoti]|uniref:Nif3-like dinuclear metal center hexameric protein n=1 Tax=Blattabacterium cuenoti TaxID=1653831 RepID=UPI00163B9512|nr:Nif3-like dinuclear metal center hexameric protein [Blattabacterium cuenoti]
MKIFAKDIIIKLEKLAPKEYSEYYDNVGLIIGCKEQEIKNILLTLDLTEKVIEEAIKKNCNFIITFHPIIFYPIKKINGDNFTERILINALKNDILIYSIHTNLDYSWNGISSYITNILGINKEKVLIPKKNIMKKLYTYVPIDYTKKVRDALFKAGAGEISNYSHCSYSYNGIGSYMGNKFSKPFIGDKNKFCIEKETCISVIFPSFKLKNIKKSLFDNHPYEEISYEIHNIENINPHIGIGIVGDLYKEINEYNFLSLLKDKMNLSYIKHSKFINRNIKRVSIINGSGRFGIEQSIKESSDAFITSDLKYHDFFKSEDKILIIEIDHYESEIFFKKLIKTFLEKDFNSIFIYESKINTNPIKYFS